MLRRIPIPLVGLVGLLLAVDGMVAWLAGAPTWGWGLTWAVGTGLLVDAFLARLGQRSPLAVGFGLLTTVLLLLLVFLKGETVSAIRLDTIPTIILFLVIFVGGIAIGIASLLSGRASVQGADFLVYIVAGLAIVILLNYVAARHVKNTFDVTRSKLESLSDQTLAKLRALNAEVHLIAFYRDSDPERSDYSDLLKKYEAASGHFSFEFVDPDKYPDVALRENVDPHRMNVIVKSGGRREIVTGTQEKDLTSAVIKVTRPGVKRIYFSTWHGERQLDTDLSAVKGALADLDYAVETFKLADGEIPTDCAVFVIAGPTTPFAPLEVERLERYLGSGKSLLVMLDADSVASGLEELLAKYGASPMPNLIIERQRGLVPYAGGYYMGEQQSMYARTTRYTQHAIVEDLANYRLPTGFYTAREVRWVRPDTTLRASGEAFVFAGTRSSFAETDVRGVLRNPREARNPSGEANGPFPVGVAVAAPPTDPLAPPGSKTRLVVFGDSDFATDRGIGQERGNGDLIVNTLTWLSEDEDLVAIRPREPGVKPVQLTTSQGTFVFLFSVWRYPAVIFVVGLLIWWYRRSRGPNGQTT